MKTSVVTNITKKYLSSVGLSEQIIINGDVSDIEYMSLSGGKLTGDIILDGNFIQTNSISGVYNFSGKNAYIQAETSKYGIACTGTKGYCILGTNSTTKTLKLSGDISEIINRLEAGSLTSMWSFSLDNYSNSLAFKIISAEQTEISAGTVTVDMQFNEYQLFQSKTEEKFIDLFFNDDNGIYYPADPTFGNQILINCYGNHSEGQSTKALGRQTHAEGRVTTADIKYSHAEGTFTYAGNMGSHAEGYGANGHINMAIGMGSHAEGWFISAFGDGSHAEGYINIAYNDYSHSEGSNNIAFGSSSHVEGTGPNYAGSRFFEVLSSNKTNNTLSLATVTDLAKDMEVIYDGSDVSCITGCKILNVDTTNNTISVTYIPNNVKQFSILSKPNLGDKLVEGGVIKYSNFRGKGAHCEGTLNNAFGDFSHAEGQNNIAIGSKSHVHGCFNKAGYAATAAGRGNSAYAAGSIALGSTNNSEKYDSTTINKAKNSFAWSGNGKYEISENKEGTFNINPTGGTSGFYIGNTSLATLLAACGKSFDESAKADLTTNDGKTEAIKQILLLLGMKESNIKTL